MMTSGRYGPALRQIGRLLGGGSVASQGSQHLLERFAATRDESAFEALIHQHGPMVLGTCRRMLADPHDVEDAFQATFLVLARRAGSIQDADRLGPWLHGVARRVASRSRALSARRNSLQRASADEPAAEAPATLEAAELRAALDEELASLPDKYRAPLVLCYLEGLTHDEAAQQLRWPVGTVRSRLAGGRDRLRNRLTRRGLAPTAAVPMILARAAIPQSLLSTTVRVATAPGTIPAHVATLAKGVLVAMIWNKFKVIGALGLMTGLTVGGAGIAAQQAEKGEAPALVTAKTPKSSADLRKEEIRVLGEQVFEAEKKEEDLKYQLKLTELTGRHLEIQLGLGVDPESARSWLKEANERIKELEGDLAKKAAAIKPLAERAREKAKPSTLATKSGKTDTSDLVKPANQPKKSPSLLELGGDYVLVVPDEIDRVAALNTRTGNQVTLLLPTKIDDITPQFIGPRFSSVCGFTMRGADVRRIATFDYKAGTWYSQDLREPTSEANPLVSDKDVVYPIGRFIYVFRVSTGKWSVLELEHNPGKSISNMNNLKDRRLIVPDGDLIHIYDAETGTWTHNKTNAPGVESPKPPGDAVSPAPSPTKPAEKPARVDETPKPDDLAKLQGQWELRTVQPMRTELFAGTIGIAIDGKTLVFLVPRQEDDRYEFILGEENGAKTIDVVLKGKPDKKGIGRWLYRLEDDTLKICIGATNGLRPTEFKPGDPGPYPQVWTFGRPSAFELKKLQLQVDDKIKLLKKELADQKAKTHLLQQQLDNQIPAPTSAPKAETPIIPGGVGPAPGTGSKPAATGPAGPNPLPRQPRVITLDGNPPRFLVISAELDRLTMIHSQNQQREILRLREPLTEITPIVEWGKIGFILKGPKITGVPLYDFQARAWTEHELKEPATEIHTLMSPQIRQGGSLTARQGGSMTASMIGLWLKGPEFTRIEIYNGTKQEWVTQDLREPAKGEVAPIVTATTISYRIGRFLYIYSAIAGKWSVLELKREDAGLGGMGGGAITPMTPDGNGRVIITEDNIIHIYDANTGDWTHIDTKDEK